MAPIRLHLGCGKRFIPGFVHVDAIPAPHVDIVGPVDVLPYADGAVDLIYASHVLEHFGRNEVSRVLREWRRVLCPAGVLRLAVPDFEACARLYVDGRISGGLLDILGLVCGGQRDVYDYHKMVFDEAYLTRLLIEAGFTSVRRWDWRETEHRDVDDYSQAYLPHLDKERGQLVSLNLEADAG